VIALIFRVAFVLPMAAGSLQLSNTARAGLRNSIVTNDNVVEAADGVSVDLKLLWPRTYIQATYTPTLSLLDDVDVANPILTFLHAGHARAGYAGSRLTFTLDQSFSYGQQSYVDLVRYIHTEDLGTPATASASVLGTNGTARFDLIPGAQAVSIAAERTQAFGSYRFTPRWNVELRASYGFSGGRNTRARELLPRQDTLEGAAAITFNRTMHSRVSFGAQASQLWTSQNYEHSLAALTANWTEDIAAHSVMSLTTNLTHQISRMLSAGEYIDVDAWIPGGAASLAHRIVVGQATYLGVLARADFSPTVNTLLGTLQKRVNATCVLDLEYRRIVASFAGTFGQTFPLDAPDTTRILAGNATLRLVLNERMSAISSVQVARQWIQTSPALTPLLWTAYVGLSASTSPFLF
jgi:hypothetical protein